LAKLNFSHDNSLIHLIGLLFLLANIPYFWVMRHTHAPTHTNVMLMSGPFTPDICYDINLSSFHCLCAVVWTVDLFVWHLVGVKLVRMALANRKYLKKDVFFISQSLKMYA